MDEEKYDEEQKQPGVVEQTARKVGNMAENKAKKTFWEWIKPHLPAILSAISWFCLILLAVGIIILIPYLIMTFFTSLFTTASAAENPSDVSSAETANIVTLGDNGEYKISVENLADQILEKLESQKVDVKAAGFSVDDLDNMIDKYIKAEIQTTYPKTGVAGNEFDGVITIYRASAETGETIPLKYMKYNDFKNYTEEDVLEYFSLEPETFKLCIAREGDSTTYKDKNGNSISGIDDTSNEGIIKETIEYKTALQNYSVPLNFFIALHMMSQDVDFMNDFVDMVLGNDKTEPIVLTYVESKSTTTTQKEYSGTKTVSGRNQTINPETLEVSDPEIFKNNPVSIDENEILSNNYYTPEWVQKVVITTSGSLQVNKADTWLKTVEKTITENNSEDGEFQSDGDPVNVATREVELELNPPVTNPDNTVTYNISKKAHIEVNEETFIKNAYKTYTIVDSQNKINVDAFAEWLQNDYPKVANNLTTAPSTLFYLLQQNESTQQLEKIMRYVIYKLNGINYGYTEENLESLLSEFYYSYTSGIYGGSIQEKIWWALIDAGCTEYAAAGVLGNVAGESGGRSNNLQEGYEKSLGYTDETYTDAVNSGAYSKQQFINDGAGYGIVQWTTSDRKKNLYEFLRERKKVSIDDENMQIEFMLGEIFGKEYANGMADKITDWFEDNYGCTFEGWMNASSASEAAEQFCWIYENPYYDDAHITSRQAEAEYWYEQFHGKKRRRNYWHIYRNSWI